MLLSMEMLHHVTTLDFFTLRHEALASYDDFQALFTLRKPANNTRSHLESTLEATLQPQTPCIA